MNLRTALITAAIALCAAHPAKAAQGADAAQASTVAAPSAAGTAALPPGVPYAAPTDPVRIAAIELPEGTLHGGDTATATVITTSNAAAVTARIGGYVLNLPKTAPGTFVMAVHIPRMPFPSYRARIVVTAIRPDGATVQSTVSLKIKY